jgi:hypothetical protein
MGKRSKEEINKNAWAYLNLLQRATKHDAIFDYSQPRLFNLIAQQNNNSEQIIEFINAAEPVFKSVMGVSPLIWDEYIQPLDLAKIKLPDTGDCLTNESAETVAQAGYFLCQDTRHAMKNTAKTCPPGLIAQLMLCWSLLRQILDQASDRLGLDTQDMRFSKDGFNGGLKSGEERRKRKARAESLMYEAIRQHYDKKEGKFFGAAETAAAFIEYAGEHDWEKDDAPMGIVSKRNDNWDPNKITAIGFEKSSDEMGDEYRDEDPFDWYKPSYVASPLFGNVRNMVKEDLKIK